MIVCMLFLFSESWNWTMMLSWHPDHPPSSPHRPITSIQVSKLLYKRATLHTRPLTGPKGCVHGPRAFGTFPSDKSCRAPRATVLQPQTTSYAAATLNAPFCSNVAPSAHQEVHGSSNCQSSECHVYWSLVLKVYKARSMMRLQFATSFHKGHIYSSMPIIWKTILTLWSWKVGYSWHAGSTQNYSSWIIQLNYHWSWHPLPVFGSTLRPWYHGGSQCQS